LTTGTRGNKKFLPFRPIVLGGDDLTIIVKSEFALNFTEEFLKAFEQETEQNMKALFTTSTLTHLMY
jgi:hypothetical protein